jgi:hypothetical protein
MNAERFRALLEAYGGDLARWPDAERLAAHGYAQEAPEAPALLADACRIDALLGAAVVAGPRADLEGAILWTWCGRVLKCGSPHRCSRPLWFSVP